VAVSSGNHYRIATGGVLFLATAERVASSPTTILDLPQQPRLGLAVATFSKGFSRLQNWILMVAISVLGPAQAMFPRAQRQNSLERSPAHSIGCNHTPGQ
jgi:hypothetical protein